MVTDIVLDVDTGVDDALALLLAATHPGVRLRAVSCVGGNTGLAGVVRNTLAVLETAGRDDVPVAAGATRPLINDANDARAVHGVDGLGGVTMPPPRGSAVRSHAVELLRDVIVSTPGGVTLIALGPLTNLALLLRIYPEVVSGINHLMVMGGSAGWGNVTATAEFNVWHDPEAAAIVLGGRPRTTMYGLDVFYSVAPTRDDVTKLPDTPVGQLAARLLGTRENLDPRLPAGTIGSLGDAGAVCGVIDPAGMTTRRLGVSVNLAAPARGQTIVDHRHNAGENQATPSWPVDVALDVDGPRYVDLFTDTLSGSK